MVKILSEENSIAWLCKELCNSRRIMKCFNGALSRLGPVLEIEETSDEDEMMNVKQDAGTGTDDQEKEQTEDKEQKEKPSQDETAGEDESENAEKQTSDEENKQETTGEEVMQDGEAGEKEENIENVEEQAENQEDKPAGVFCIGTGMIILRLWVPKLLITDAMC